VEIFAAFVPNVIRFRVPLGFTLNIIKYRINARFDIIRREITGSIRF